MTLSSLSAAVVVANETLRAETLRCLDNLPVRIVFDQKHLDDTEELLDRIERHRADVVLLESSLLAIPLDEFARRLKLTASQPAIFVLHGEAAAQNILEAIQAGAREYLCPPLVAPLKEAFERLSEVRSEQVVSQQKKLGRIYGFLSAKGGCGATTFASHTATSMAQQTGQPVLLADLDFEAGILRFILKAKTPYSLRDALDNMHRMDTSYWNALVTKQANQLEFIAAPEELTARSLPDPKQLSRLLRFIRATYPLAILDFGRCYSAAALDSMAELEALFLLVTQDLEVLDHGKDFVRMAEERGKPMEKIRVLLNKVSAKQKSDPAGLKNYLGIPIAGVFADDAEGLYEVWSEGRLLGDGSELGRQLRALAKTISTHAVDESAAKLLAAGSAAAAANSAAGGMGRLFSFMRRSRA